MVSVYMTGENHASFDVYLPEQDVCSSSFLALSRRRVGVRLVVRVVYFAHVGG